MVETVQINCTSEAGDYVIVLHVHSIDPFVAAAQSNLFISNTGEELAQKLVAANRGTVLVLERCTLGGKCNDSPLGHPGFVSFNPDGIVVKECHYRNGKSNDSVNGEPAVKHYSDVGILLRTEHHKDGLVQDGPNGEAAIIAYNPDGTLATIERLQESKYQDTPDGQPALIIFGPNNTIRDIEHYHQGLMHDGVNGEPAAQEYNADGLLITAGRYCDGTLLKNLTLREIAAYIAYRGGLNAPPRLSGPAPKPF